MDKFEGIGLQTIDHSNIFMELFDNMEADFSNSHFEQSQACFRFWNLMLFISICHK